MTYRVETVPVADEQLAALPRAGQLAYKHLRTLLIDDPWQGAPWADRIHGTMLDSYFGDHSEGLATYVVLERDERVVVVRITWLA